MTIRKDHAVSFDSGRGGKTITTIVLHSTNGFFGGTISWFKNPQAKASTHYVVSRTGEVVQMVEESDTAWHASNYLVNQQSIGIECADDLKVNDPRPDALYEAVAELVRDICTRHQLPIDRTTVRKHGEVASTPCPWALDVDRIVSMALAGTANPVPTYTPSARNVVVTAVEGANIRSLPQLDSSIIRVAAKGESLSVRGWVKGGSLDNKDRWWLLSDQVAYLWAGTTNVYPLDPSASDPPAPLPSEPMSSSVLEVKIGELQRDVTLLTQENIKLEKRAKEQTIESNIKDERISELEGMVKNMNVLERAAREYEQQIDAYKTKVSALKEQLKDSLLQAFSGWQLYEAGPGPTGVVKLTGVILSLLRLVPAVLSGSVVVGWKVGAKLYTQNSELPAIDK